MEGIKTGTPKILEYIGLINAFSYIIVISGFSLLTAYILLANEGFQELTIKFFPVFILIFPVLLPLGIEGKYLIISLIALYTSLSIYESLRRIDGRRPIHDIVMLGSATLFITLVIQFIQSQFGIETGMLDIESEYLFFLSAAQAVIAEEIGFRLFTVGLASLALYMFGHRNGDDRGSPLKALLHPYSVHRGEALKTLYAVVVAQAVLFGSIHYLAGGGWDIGKISLATVAGLYLGYLYLKYGLTASILGHAYFNVFLLTVGYLSEFGANYSNIFLSLVGGLIFILVIISGFSYFIYVAWKGYLVVKSGQIQTN